MKAPSVRPVRCAIYTRVSTEHGLDQEFNSLDAQYEAASGLRPIRAPLAAPEASRDASDRNKPQNAHNGSKTETKVRGGVRPRQTATLGRSATLTRPS
jgi:hypothetical protein